MSKYQFDGSNYENWKPEEFPTGYVCPEGGTSTNCYTGGWRSYLGFREMLQLYAVLGLLPRFLY